QTFNGAQHEIPSAFVLHPSSIGLSLPQVSFQVGAYDHSRPLVIDPLVLGYSTYLGGSAADQGFGIAVDGAGNTYVTGTTLSTNFPVTPGAVQLAKNGGEDAFIAKLNAAGSALVYATYLGASKDDIGAGIAVDGSGNAYVTGYTTSNDFPTTSGVFDPKFNNGAVDG